MRNKLCLLLIIMLFLTQNAFAVEYGRADNGTYEQAVELVNLIFGERALQGSPDRTVSRKEFVFVLGNLFKCSADISEVPSFGDVDKDDYGADEIYIAEKLGYIAPAQLFRPQDPISADAAVKLAVCYAGYKEQAERKGVYPFGYIEVASEKGFLKSLGSDFFDRSFTLRDAEILCYNLMFADYVAIDSISQKLIRYKEYENNLSYIHGIYFCTGVLNASTYTSLTGEVRERENGLIEINGIKYKTLLDCDNLLGYNCAVFYEIDGEERTVLAMLPVKNTEYSFDLEQLIKMKDGKIEYYDEGKSSPVYIYADRTDVSMIYNGCGVYPDMRYLESEGTIRLVDNDCDGKCEVIFIDSLRYGIIDRISTSEGEIGFKDSYGINNINLYNDVVYEIKNASGENINVYDLNEGDFLAVKESEDGRIIAIELCNDSVTGSLQSMDYNGGEIGINGTDYKISEYFKENYFSKLSLGSTYSFVLSPNGKVIATSESVSVYTYGYLTAYESTSRAFAAKRIKVFSQSGDMLLLDCDKNIKVDGADSKIDGDKFIERLSDGVYPCPSLVKIKYSSDKKLIGIDFPHEYTNGADRDGLPEDNSLVRYIFSEKTSFTYRSGARSCMPYFNLQGSIIFKIPNDLSEESYYEVTDSSTLLDNNSYSFEIYDIDEAGTAGVLVWKTSDVSEPFSFHHNTYIVEDVTSGIDNEGNEVFYVYCWSLGKFYILYMDYGFAVRKDSGNSLCGGDIIRVRTDKNNKITSMVVDFDASGGLPKKNSYAGSIFELGNVSFTYQFGKLYSVKNNYAYITNVTNAFGEYDYSFENLKNYYVNTRYIVKYDMTNKKLRPIKLSELKSYIAYGDDNHYAVLRQNVYNVNSIYIYE